MTPATIVPSAGLPLVEELAPAPAAWHVARKLADRPHLLFLDSALATTALGRWSFVTADPFAWLSARGAQVWLDDVPQPERDPFAVLARLLAAHRLDPLLDGPPFQGGAAGLFGYDLCHHLERLPLPRFNEFETPDLAVGFYDWVAAFDHLDNRAWLISTGLPETDPDRRRRRVRQRIDQARRWLSRPGPVRAIVPGSPGAMISPTVRHPLPGVADLYSSFDRPGFLEVIRRGIDYVHAGDCFQVNLAQRLLHRATVPPLELYGRLRECNPAPFAGCLDTGDFVIASASPERFVRVRGRHVETRPIKGTRPRGATPAEDAARMRELLSSDKDRAENVMIIDLLRNDLGRVCAYGSVRVPSVCRLESYQTVHHLVSEVRGELRPGLGPIDVLRAAFPGGSVTGAPKVRAMEIIAELEPTARGPYCGSLGYIGFDGSMDTSILIRTFTIGKGWIQFPVGGGIVADSTPEGEYAETLHKAEGLLRALR
jgi:para-aminobenzoate synthetase component 1